MLKVKYFKVFLLFAAAVCGTTLSQSSLAAGPKLAILVLYESLCPDSERFIAHQLGPAYDELQNHIDITLVPFGKSYSQNNGAQFFCQHGPAECEGNRMQSCVLHQTNNQTQQVRFAVCQMTIADKSSVAPCAAPVGLSGSIDDCMGTETGTYLQLEAEKITNAYRPSFVPTIIYDRVFDQQLQDVSLRNFRAVVCELLQKRNAVAPDDNVCK